LAANPSLKASNDEVYASAYRLARREASTEADLDVSVFPADPPFTLDEALDPDFLPEPRG
jgi:hypothetical protein